MDAHGSNSMRQKIGGSLTKTEALELTTDERLYLRGLLYERVLSMSMRRSDNTASRILAKLSALTER